MQCITISLVAARSMSERNENQGSGSRSEAISEILGSETGQEIPVQGGRRPALSQMFAFDLGKVAAERLLLRQASLFKGLFNFCEPLDHHDLASTVRDVPDFSGRYYSVQFTDPFDVDFAYVGTRTTGTQAGDYVITGPDWKGQVPTGTKQIASPTNSILVIGRILVYSDSDVPTAYALTKQITVVPLIVRQRSQ